MHSLLLLAIAVPLGASTVQITQGTMTCQPPACGTTGTESRLVLSGVGNGNWSLYGSIQDGWFLGWDALTIDIPTIGPWSQFQGRLEVGGVGQPGTLVGGVGTYQSPWSLTAATISLVPGQSFYSESFSLSASGVEMMSNAGYPQGISRYGPAVDLAGSGTLSLDVLRYAGGIPQDIQATFDFGGGSASGAAVPEPSTAALALLGLIALGQLRSRVPGSER